MSARAIFVTGTDTGCGKTAVACALAEAARVRGLRVRALKPIETGCIGDRPEDALALARAAGDARPLDALCPYRLALPAAPDVAARAEGVSISLDRIVRAFEDTAADADLVVVEGAGGLLVPILDGLDMAGLAQRLGLPLLLVARAALGTINHTLLSIEAAARRKLDLAGVAISHTQPVLPAAERENLDWLLHHLARAGVPVLGELAHRGAPEGAQPNGRAGAGWLGPDAFDRLLGAAGAI